MRIYVVTAVPDNGEPYLLLAFASEETACDYADDYYLKTGTDCVVQDTVLHQEAQQ